MPAWMHRDNLNGSEPGRESPGVVLEQHREESLNGTEQCSVNHDWALTCAVGSLVFEVESLRQVVVHLNRRHLPTPSDRIARLHRNLRPIERSAARVEQSSGYRILDDAALRAVRSPPPRSITTRLRRLSSSVRAISLRCIHDPLW